MTTTKRKAGRPPKRPDEVAEVHADVRMTRILREQLRAAALRRSMALGAWLREAAIEKLARESEGQ